MLLQFLEVAMNIDPQEKMIRGERIEKYILRKAFDTSDEPDVQPYLPDSILWRQKEQFSDGVGYGWIDALKDTAEKMVTDEMFKNPKPEWGDDIPDTKEAYVDQLKRTEMLDANPAATGTGTASCSTSTSRRRALRPSVAGRPSGPSRPTPAAGECCPTIGFPRSKRGVCS
jgi:asparagine synthetase B (glutamine-hydrolysing)